MTLDVVCTAKARSQINALGHCGSKVWCHEHHSSTLSHTPVWLPPPLPCTHADTFPTSKQRKKLFISLHGRVFSDGLWREDSGGVGSSLAGEVSRPQVFLITAWPAWADTFLQLIFRPVFLLTTSFFNLDDHSVSRFYAVDSSVNLWKCKLQIVHNCISFLWFFLFPLAVLRVVLFSSVAIFPCRHQATLSQWLTLREVCVGVCWDLWSVWSCGAPFLSSILLYSIFLCSASLNTGTLFFSQFGLWMNVLPSLAQEGVRQAELMTSAPLYQASKEQGMVLTAKRNCC